MRWNHKIYGFPRILLVVVSPPQDDLRDRTLNHYAAQIQVCTTKSCNFRSPPQDSGTDLGLLFFAFDHWDLCLFRMWSLDPISTDILLPPTFPLPFLSTQHYFDACVCCRCLKSLYSSFSWFVSSRFLLPFLHDCMFNVFACLYACFHMPFEA